jgi:hypothetical protein
MRYQHQGLSRVVAVSCACLLLLPVGAFVPMLQGAQDSANRMKQLVEALGAGAEVKITLSTEEVRGVISDIAQDRFALDIDRNRPESRFYFTYVQVRKLTLARMNYKASGETDLVAVKRILYVVGTGKHVLVRTRDSRKVRGRIQTIGQDQFILETGGSTLTGSSTGSFQIAYQQVLEVKPKPRSSTAKTLIITGASVGAGLLGALLIYVMTYQG